MPINNRFRVRNADTAGDDARFIVAAFDSTLPYLTSIGSGEQWGSTPFSARENFVEETAQSVEQSVRYERTGEGDPTRALIVEVQTPTPLATNCIASADGDTQRLLPVGAAVVRSDWFPGYITSLPDLEPEIKKAKSFLYLEVIITDFTAGVQRNGAGAALIRDIVQYGREKSKAALYVDCWTGNNGKLNRQVSRTRVSALPRYKNRQAKRVYSCIDRYYEQQGFTKVAEFSFQRRNGTLWPGALFRMHLTSTEHGISTK